MRVRRLNLGSKFSIAVTLLIVLTMLGVATLILGFQRESLRQSTLDSGRAMTRNLAHDAEEPLLMFDPLRLDEMAHTVLAASSATYAMIVDRHGIIVAHTDRSLLGSRPAKQGPPEQKRPFTGDQEQIRDLTGPRGELKEFSVPIMIGTEVLGFAAVAYSLDDINGLIESRLGSLRRYIFLITGIMLLAGIAGAFAVSAVLTRPLRNLKDRMLDVQSGNLDVSAENPRVRKCWERLDCNKEDCPAYGKLRCWAIAGTFCRGEVQGDFARKIGDCRNCVVYQESCGDEIHELVEVFNQMLKDLRHNLDQLDKANSDKARLERLSALGEMGTTVAHEIKNPLNSIRLAASYLRKNFQGEILTEFLRIIEEEVRRLDEITSSFLGFSKPAPLRLTACDVNAVVRPTVDLIRQDALDRNIEVVVVTDEHLPPVSCDFGRIKQALLNLLVNALDASAPGGTITVSTELRNAAVILSVHDTGTGIAPEVLANIFKPFYTTKTRGSGLGLAVVDRIVKEHGAAISIESEPGTGTTFMITMPLERHA